MEVRKIPEHWNDCGMDWTNPDPYDFCYYLAIYRALNERVNALCVSYPYPSGYGAWWYNETGSKKHGEIVSTPQLGNISYKIQQILYNHRSSIFFKEQFLHDETRYRDTPFSFANIERLVTYMLPGRGCPVSAAKEFLIQTRALLDQITMFAYPYVKANCHKGYSQILSSSEASPETAIELFIQELGNVGTNETITNKFNFRIQASTKIYSTQSNLYVYFDDFPKSVVNRSFAKPHVYLIVKPGPGSYEDLPEYKFPDFGYGFAQKENTVLDLGQLPEEKDAEIQVFPHDLAKIKAVLSGGDSKYHFYAYGYFALDYNCEGGFKFRPDDTNLKE